MSARHRICETCVYCSFAGNCDRYDKPLTSIEQPACNAYEIHPLLAKNAKLREERDMYRDLVGHMVHPDIPDQLHAENAKLRELIRDMWQAWWACDNEKCPRYSKHCDTEEFCAFDDCMRELGIMVQS